ncbi:MAG: hypothetical protein LBQ33_05350 [Oscillospiraceae bacterium]|jgi:hypothetical protein|nr:hypothetical protein [Oscillospiraceae bacterium]
MIKAIAEHPLLALALLASIVLCVFAWQRALRAAKRRQAQKEKLIEALEREKKLRADFASLTRQQMDDSPAERLMEGVCCNIQLWLEAQPDMNAAYAALPLPKRLLYALGYVVQDSRKGLTHFFRANGRPLTPDALQAVEQLVGGGYAAVFRRAYDAFDEENEEASVLPAYTAQWDEDFAKAAAQPGLYDRAKDYVLAHAEVFCGEGEQGLPGRSAE